MIKKLKIENWKLEIPTKRAGFTVLESIVAIAILSLSISGAFSAVQQSLSEYIITRDETRAFYLAQEAIEVIRNKRDNNQLNRIANPASPNTWLYGITQNASDPCYFGRVCRVDAVFTPPSLTYCNSSSWGNCSYLKQNQSTFMYGYTTGNTTTFKREVQIESITADEIAVIVRISWNKGPISKNFMIKTFLFNWAGTL
ncbi:MAG: hypothetical protein A3E02_01275 [Candidatus Zambryskibacteria bacterium RIFCSPHIGHO2_12_FULL_38_34]|uniref:Type II secretion system protein GspI C-terminal domain-containing protein n=1 Tax=Candidatus Zambryskibacteria bacterium RIFCSPLOWO2_12_FULL_39_16 TaxID=1802775 RepID=A0A1G2UTZ7_9BACT|nr:MAG: hypothetical protein A3D37_01630 [Candidatus Zambryskibacteria bacterium RIFCSPHIGHO2_02_FULL_38_22]OHA97559.1 MAG: hypothetical protein A3E02_01275 [Candidatus Zambryskibacteria bacterium RIFCSPHIGHO2_12_FULL_38_34]OHB08144.1 MAG: hypothetical protein A3I19_02475 [Candidatus Zambryskibacteria bacterium RIFCSPLOWO2_02_FULL_38_13]OHB12838.1 MAG: hypothetical protein A3G46_02370 [Candidatus Zambryskibacteria bacterium RIFCSPLOWO2_12_FULL_39_16]